MIGARAGRDAQQELEQLAVSVLPHCLMPHLAIQCGNELGKFSPAAWGELATLVATSIKLSAKDAVGRLCSGDLDAVRALSVELALKNIKDDGN